MFVGLVRIFEPGSQARPHQDILAWDVPSSSMAAATLLTQLSANIYLRPCADGGELELWDYGLSRPGYEKLKVPATHGLDRDRLPPGLLKIRPELGELIIFNSTRIHAVCPIITGTRITASCFIGVRETSVPLTVWS